MNELYSNKAQLRKILSERRKLIKSKSFKEFNIKAFDKLSTIINFDEIKYFASFFSIKSEISTIKLNDKILEMKKVLSFPVIQKQSKDLIFKQYNFKENLKIGQFNIPEPINTNEEVTPQLFFVPCLGFDLDGNRLGYGGGFYDKTFSKLNKLQHKFYTVGYAFDDQKQNKIPKEDFDYKLDFVLTEKQLYKFI